jgi:acyl-CoA thioester hydrolase
MSSTSVWPTASIATSTTPRRSVSFLTSPPTAIPGHASVRPAMPAPFVQKLRVRYGECDPQGIVFNANYLLYFDVAFTELWRAAVGPWQEMIEHGVDAVVADARLSFRAPARFDDEIELLARIAKLGTTSITTEIDVVRADAVLVSGTLRHVCVSAQPEIGQSTPWPPAIRRALEAFGACSD